MIPLSLPLMSDADQPFICRVLESGKSIEAQHDALIVGGDGDELALSSAQGMFVVTLDGVADISGDVLLVDPAAQRAERIFRAGSNHNTLLVTERCDQLCVMCSQPPKKRHVDRFRYFEQATLLCEPDGMVGISGGEPTLYKDDLFQLIEKTFETRPDLGFHILSNGQHFEATDIERLKQPAFRNVTWGIPLYASTAELHDEIVGKRGAFERLKQSFAYLMQAAARVELRTVLLSTNCDKLEPLARFVAGRLSFIECWSIMQLENIGFAKNRWSNLYWDHQRDFQMIAAAIDQAQAQNLNVRLFNFPRCTVPANYRHLAPASISDWKRKYVDGCAPCTQKEQCAGFFEWHPSAAIERVTPL